VAISWKEDGREFVKRVRMIDLVGIDNSITETKNYNNCFFFKLHWTWWFWVVFGIFLVLFATFMVGFIYYFYFYLLPHEKAKYFEECNFFEKNFHDIPDGRNYFLEFLSALNIIIDVAQRLFP